MEATYSSETSVDFQRTTRRYIPEDRTLYIQSVQPGPRLHQWRNLLENSCLEDLEEDESPLISSFFGSNIVLNTLI
jgi:hypothetical protein